jgi:hypothetical protein
MNEMKTKKGSKFNYFHLDHEQLQEGSSDDSDSQRQGWKNI